MISSSIGQVTGLIAYIFLFLTERKVRGGNMSKFRQGCSSYFLGLKFGQILFCWVGKCFS